jgi:hypothetical protein
MAYSRKIAIAILLTVLSAVNAWATPIMFIHTAEGEGTLGGQPFSGNFTITGFGDTDDRQDDTFGFHVNYTSASIDIDGVGSFCLITAFDTWVGNTGSDGHGLVGIGRVFGADGGNLNEGPADPAFETYDLLTSIGPIFGTAFFTNLSPIRTSGGTLLFNEGQGFSSDASFQAILNPSTCPVCPPPAGALPEPGTVLLLASGLIPIGIVRWRS